MPGLSDYSARKVLDHLVGKTSFTMPTNAYVALFTAAPNEAGSGTEVSGGSYARKQTAAADWNAAAGSGPASNSNANDLQFPAATADWGDVVAWALFDAASSGNMLVSDYLGAHSWKPFSTTDTGGDTIQAPGHGYSNGDRVVFSAEFGGSLPTGITGGTIYYVVGTATDTFQISTSLGGSAVNITAVGSGMVRKVQVKTIQSGDTAKFAGGAPGQLVLQAA
jgi:hypothetical protein